MSAHMSSLTARRWIVPPSLLVMIWPLLAQAQSAPLPPSDSGDATAPAAPAVRATDPSPPASRPAGDGGAVTQALTNLYQIPLPPGLRAGKQNANNTARGLQSPDAPRQFGAPGRGEAPRTVITDSNLGRQHTDAIRNSVSPQAVGDPLRQPPAGDHITQRPDNGPAIPPENSLTASHYSPYTDDRYAPPASDQNTAGDLPPGQFGFVRSPQQAHWAPRALSRSQSVLSTAGNYMSRGLAAFRTGDYRTAARHFKMAADNNQGDPSAMLYSAHALFAIGRYQEGTAWLRKAFSLEPRIALLTYDMRDDYRDKAEFDQHLRTLRDALAVAPGNMDRLVMLGYVLNYSNQPDGAFEALSRARGIDPKDKLVGMLYDRTQPPDVADAPRKFRRR